MQRLLGEQEVELSLRSGRLPAGDEVRGIGDPHPLKREFAVSYEPLHPAGDLRVCEREPRRQHAPAGQYDRLEAGSQGVEVEQVSDVLRRGGALEHGAREHEVRARLRDRAVQRVLEARAADDDVCSERERPGRDCRD